MNTIDKLNIIEQLDTCWETLYTIDLEVLDLLGRECRDELTRARTIIYSVTEKAETERTKNEL